MLYHCYRNRCTIVTENDASLLLILMYSILPKMMYFSLPITPVALFCPKTKHDSLMPIRLWTGLSEGSSLPVSASSCRWLCASLYSDSLCMTLAGTLTSSLVQNSSGWVRKCLLASIGGTLLPAFRFPLYTCAWHHRISMMQSPVPSVCRIA